MNYIFKNTGRVCTVLALAATTLLSSCLKDNSPGSVDFSKSPALVGFQYAGFSATPYTAPVLPTAGAVYSAVEVTLSVPSLTLKSAVTVKVTEDAAGEAAYAAAQKAAGNTVNVLPTSDYSYSSNVTISPGQQIVKVPITFAGDKIDFSKNYYLGLQLTDASGATIETNLNEAIVAVILKSPYQGLYTVTGSFVDKVNAGITDKGIFPITNVQLRTASATSVNYYDPKLYGGNSGYYTGINSNGSYSVYGNFAPVFTFNPSTNKVVSVVNYYGQGTNSSGRSATIDPSVTATSSGTPGTAGFTFTVGFILVGPTGPRTYYNETFTYTGAY